MPSDAPAEASAPPSESVDAATADDTSDDQPEDEAPRASSERDTSHADEEPNPYVAPLVRREGDLTINAPPPTPSMHFVGRLRTHVQGGLSKGTARLWVGPQVPGFVPLLDGSSELFLLDRVGDEFVAMYRDPYGAPSCSLDTNTNCRIVARLFDIRGNVKWSVDLSEHWASPTHLEVQDIRYDGKRLYYNEACQSYSSEAGGRCSYLVAYDPTANDGAGAIAWRSKALVSNGRFIVLGDYLVTGYGFTSEPDFIYVVDTKTGKVKQRLRTPKSAETFEIVDDGRLEVTIYSSPTRHFRLEGWDTEQPKLVRDEG